MTSTTNVRPPRGARDKSHKLSFELSKMTDGPSSKIQPTAEQIRLAQMINDGKGTDDPELQLKVKQVMELTGKSSDEASVALHDCDNDPTRAINMLLEGESDQGEWELTTKRKKNRPANSQLNADVTPSVTSNNKENRNRPEKGKDRESKDKEGIRNRGPPRLNKGKVRDAEKNERNLENSLSRERSSDRRGRGSRIINGSGRRGRGRGLGGRIRTFQNRSASRSEFPRSIDTWTNVQPENTDDGDPPMSVGNWADGFPTAEDWDNEDWTGSLAETKVFTPSAALPNSDIASSSVPLLNQSSIDPSASLQQPSTTPEPVGLSGTLQSVRHVAVSNAVGFGQNEVVVDMPISSGVNTISSASKQSTYASLNITSNGTSTLSSTTALSDPSTIGAMQASSKLSSTPPGTALSVAMGNSSRSLSASILSSGGHQQNSLPVRPRPQRSRNIATSRIPASAVEMPDDAIAALDVQFGSLEFGSESSSLSFSGLLDSTVTSTSSISNHIGSSSQTAPSSLLGSATMHMTSSQISKGGNDLVTADPISCTAYSSSSSSSVLPPSKELIQTVSQQSISQQPTDAVNFATTADRKTFGSQRVVQTSVLEGTKSGGSTSISNYAVQNNNVNSHANFQTTYGSHKPSTFTHHHSSLSTPVTQSPSSLYGSATVSQVQSSAPFSSVAQSVTGYGVNQTPSYSAQSQSSVYANPVSTVSTYASGSSISQTGYPSQSHSALHTSAVVNSKLNSSHTAVKDSLEAASMQHSYDTSHSVSTPGLSSTLTTASSSSLGLSSGGSLSSSSATTAKSSISTTKAGVPSLQPGLPTLLSHQYIMSQAGLPFYSLPQTMYTYEDLQLLQQRIPPMASYYDMSFQPSTNMTGRDGGLANAYTGADGKFSRGDNSSPVPTTLSQQQSSTQQHQQTFISPTALPHGYSYYYPGGMVSGFPQYGTPIFPVPPATNAHGASSNTHFQKPSAYGSHTYSTGYESLCQNQDYTKTGYGSSSQNQNKGLTGASGSVTANSVSGNDLTSSVYSKAHSQINKQPYDKPGFHAGTPPPFNLAATQSGPLGAPSTAYAAATPFITMMAQHPSPMLHHQLHQDAVSTSQRPTPTQTQSKTTSTTKQSYGTSYWASS